MHTEDPTILSRLEQAVLAGGLRPLDLYFARWMGRLADCDDPALLLAAALASHRVGEGDVCADLRTYAGCPLFGTAGETVITAPSLSEWRSALARIELAGSPERPAPLVLDAHDRLYLWRYWRFEQDLAAALLVRAGQDWPEIDRRRLRGGLERLFPRRDAGSSGAAGTDWQRVAAAMAVLQPFCVISGGPGTGKTRTVTAILALLLEQAQGRALRMAMAAPTGKAAARLGESMRVARATLDLEPAIADALPNEAVTLHRLLGFRPGRAQPRHGPDDPLHLDVLAVDEASMVDMPLMARLLAALRPDTRLILLGDKDQLASVEAGMVLGDICGRGHEPVYSPRLREALSDVAGVDLAGGRVPPIADQVAVLQRSYRFDARSGIGATARAVNGGDGDAAVAILTDPTYPDAVLEPVSARGLEAYLRKWLVPRMRACLAAGDAPAALARFNRFRILCAVREGPFGVRALNRLCERVLEAAGLIRPSGREQYAGRPLLIDRNDYVLGLYNGDVGLVLPDGAAGGALRAWFETGAGTGRVLPARLPAHETVFAMTVHKSQGSEVDEALVILPEAESRVFTRELLYTAITRARKQVTILGRADRIRAAVARPVRRSSGLYDALWGCASDSAGSRAKPTGGRSAGSPQIRQPEPPRRR